MRGWRKAWTALLAGASLAAAPAARAAGPEIALTFDDLPAHARLPLGMSRMDVARAVLDALKAAGAPPIWGFVNGVAAEREPASAPVLDAWLAGGGPLGNHTWSHLDLNHASLADWEADVIRNEPLLSRLQPGGGWRVLRFPFLSEGATPEARAGARAFLHARGYRIAGVTMSFGDYAFNDPYARCVAQGDTTAVARMEGDYLAAARGELERARAMATAAYGRDIPYVLLMHLGAFDARMLPRLLAMYRREGVRLVTLEQAQRDPAYRSDTDLTLDAPDTLEAALRARGRSPPPSAFDLSSLGMLCPDASR